MLERLEIRPARPEQADALLALQLRSSLIWEQYRADLQRSRDAIALTPGAIEQQRVRVAILAGELAGFCEWSLNSRGWELEGLFVEPEQMRKGIGGALVEDLCARARAAGVGQIVVTAGPALPFYERYGFEQAGPVRTRFGPAVRMRLELV